MSNFLARLRGIREDHDLTQAQVAEILGTSQTMYARYERGGSSFRSDIWLRCAAIIRCQQTSFWIRPRGKKVKK